MKTRLLAGIVLAGAISFTTVAEHGDCSQLTQLKLTDVTVAEAVSVPARSAGAIMAAHCRVAVTRTHPLCPYPQRAVYAGTGSTDQADNFVCKPQGRADATCVGPLLRVENHRRLRTGGRSVVPADDVTEPRETLPQIAAGTVMSVKEVNARGLEGWDWAKTSVGEPNITRITQ